jgi:hypothetical protein
MNLIVQYITGNYFLQAGHSNLIFIHYFKHYIWNLCPHGVIMIFLLIIFFFGFFLFYYYVGDFY